MTDIRLIHEMNEDLNQRIIVIKNEGDNLLDIMVSDDKKSSYFHLQYIKKYINSAYLDDELLKKIRNMDINGDGATIIMYHILKQYDNIIFMETTSDNETKRTGIMNLPDEMSEKQYKKLQELYPYFKNFSSILIQGGLQSSDHMHVTDANFAKEIKGGKIEEIDYYLKTLIKKVEEKHM